MLASQRKRQTGRRLRRRGKEILVHHWKVRRGDPKDSADANINDHLNNINTGAGEVEDNMNMEEEEDNRRMNSPEGGKKKKDRKKKTDRKNQEEKQAEEKEDEFTPSVLRMGETQHGGKTLRPRSPTCTTTRTNAGW